MTLTAVKHRYNRWQVAKERQELARDELRKAVLAARHGELCESCNGYGEQDDPLSESQEGGLPCPGCKRKGVVNAHTLAEIGAVLGITKQGVNSLLKR